MEPIKKVYIVSWECDNCKAKGGIKAQHDTNLAEAIMQVHAKRSPDCKNLVGAMSVVRTEDEIKNATDEK